MRATLAKAMVGVFAAGLLAAGHVAAQEPERRAPPPTEKTEPPRRAPTLDELFERLAAAGSPAEARPIAQQIERRWLRSGSDTADLLMTRALEAMKSADHPLAIEILDRIIAVRPGWAEAWNKRATVFFMMGDTARARADIAETLKREPRHFGALFGLASMLMRADEKKAAYEAYKRAHALHPQFAPVREALERLRPEIEGRDI